MTYNAKIKINSGQKITLECFTNILSQHDQPMEDYHPMKPELGVTITGNKQSQHISTLSETSLIIAVNTLNLLF